MSHYLFWNKAIVDFFTSNAPKGAAVFLCIDDETIAAIFQRRMGGAQREIALELFLKAVRSRLDANSEGVDLDAIEGVDEAGYPKSVCFLSAMVLAAYRMASEEGQGRPIEERDYFTRLREVLALRPGQGRPPGLRPAGVEEMLWKSWNRWLIQHGWVPTAFPGEGAWTYISYPISQTLLREGDKDRLEVHFRTAGIVNRYWDRSALAAWLRNPNNLPPRKHIRELIEEGDERRFEAFVDSAFEVFASVPWDEPLAVVRHHRRSAPSRIFAGLYRVENPFTSEISYHLYPKQPPHWQGGSFQIRQRPTEPPINLVQERPGWFRPLWPEDPTGDKQYPVEPPDAHIKEVFLPPRDFWILVRDPEDEYSGVFGSWHAPEPAETFLLLCRERYQRQLAVLKEAALFNWREQVNVNSEWLEYRECMALSSNWDEINPLEGCESFVNQLRPGVSATIALEGGLKVSGTGGWLEGYQPRITVFAAREPVAKITIKDVTGDEILQKTVDANEPASLSTLPGGNYVIEAWSGARCLSRRFLRILSWKTLETREPLDPCKFRVGSLFLRGVIVQED